MLGKLSLLGRLTKLDNSGARANCARSRCEWGLFGHFILTSVFSFFFLPVWETVRFRFTDDVFDGLFLCCPFPHDMC